ncbi:MAG: hypothetical protein PHY29_12250 [Syntrophales bacterium]|nr:hypothetical protein [Syntrophales bacterium]
MLVNFSIDTIRDGDTKMGEGPKSSLAQANTSFSGRGNVMLYSVGKNLWMAALMRELANDKSGSTVLSSATRVNTRVRSLSDRLTPSLISAGLVRGIIPTLMRKKSNQQILDSVLSGQDGNDVGEQRGD